MKKTAILALASLSIALATYAGVQMSKWNYDNSHAKLGFSITHMSLSEVDGYFKDVKATITGSKADFSDAVAEMTAEVKSINTDSEKRDGHLLSPDYFDAEKYPTITFKSTSFKKTKLANGYVVSGNLTMHGVTKPVSFAAIIRTGKNPMSDKMTAGFKVTGKVNRKDFNIGATTPEAILSNEVTINANAEFVKE